MTDLAIHLARKANLDLLRKHFPGLKIYVAERMSNDETTTYVLQSDARKQTMPFALPSDATLKADAPILRENFQPFYDKHVMARVMGGM